MTEIEAIDVICEVKEKIGRRYKSTIHQAWMSGNYDALGLDDYASRLQQIRNTFGPSWLATIRNGAKNAKA